MRAILSARGRDASIRPGRKPVQEKLTGSRGQPISPGGFDHAPFAFPCPLDKTPQTSPHRFSSPTTRPCPPRDYFPTPECEIEFVKPPRYTVYSRFFVAEDARLRPRWPLEDTRNIARIIDEGTNTRGDATVQSCVQPVSAKITRFFRTFPIDLIVRRAMNGRIKRGRQRPRRWNLVVYLGWPSNYRCNGDYRGEGSNGRYHSEGYGEARPGVATLRTGRSQDRRTTSVSVECRWDDITTLLSIHPHG